MKQPTVAHLLSPVQATAATAAAAPPAAPATAGTAGCASAVLPFSMLPLLADGAASEGSNGTARASPLPAPVGTLPPPAAAASAADR